MKIQKNLYVWKRVRLRLTCVFAFTETPGTQETITCPVVTDVRELRGFASLNVQALGNLLLNLNSA